MGGEPEQRRGVCPRSNSPSRGCPRIRRIVRRLICACCCCRCRAGPAHGAQASGCCAFRWRCYSDRSSSGEKAPWRRGRRRCSSPGAISCRDCPSLSCCGGTRAWGGIRRLRPSTPRRRLDWRRRWLWRLWIQCRPSSAACCCACACSPQPVWRRLGSRSLRGCCSCRPSSTGRRIQLVRDASGNSCESDSPSSSCCSQCAPRAAAPAACPCRCERPVCRHHGVTLSALTC